MNRSGTLPQSLRGIPAGFGGQQPSQQQQGRSVSNRLPNGKLGGNASGWAFGAGVPMGGGGLPNPSRQLGGGLSFAQSLSGSQPATPLDLSMVRKARLKTTMNMLLNDSASEAGDKAAPKGLPYASILKGEFPSLSNNSQISSSGQASMWSMAGSRNTGVPVQRNQGTPQATAQQNDQNDFFSASSRIASNQGSFRFGSQASANQSSQVQAGAPDDFPPLNRNGNGDIGQDRGASLMSTIGFGAQGSRAGNGLLNALSANSRSSEVRSPTSGSRAQDGRDSLAEEEAHQKPAPFREGSVASQTSLPGAIGMASDLRNPLGAIGKDAPSGRSHEDGQSRRQTDVQDPLAGMAEVDKWGLKGLRTLMNNYPDYNAMVIGIDPSTLGLDLTSPDLISTQHYSLFDDTPPRPAIPKYALPECYHVTNVQPIENKISSFNEETLMWIFYSCPRDRQQLLAAQELHNRNWRWHKKLHIWITKDELMTPQMLSRDHERGYYVVWDTVNWRKERRELTLHYQDLENPGQA